MKRLALVLLFVAGSALAADRRPMPILVLNGFEAGSGLAIPGVSRLVIDENRHLLIAQGEAPLLVRMAEQHGWQRASIEAPLADDNDQFTAFVRQKLGVDPFSTPGVGGFVGHQVAVPKDRPPIADAPTRVTPETDPIEPNSTILSEDFEGPLTTSSGGHWEIYVKDQTQTYYWGKTTCSRVSGSYSVDAVRGGNGSSLGCSSNYPAGLRSWLYWNTTFSLVGRSGPKLDFAAAVSTSTSKDSNGFPWDYFGVYVHEPNATNATGYYWFGSISWTAYTFDLTNWYGMGDLRGYSALYIFFYFGSDGVSPSGYGARLDDVAMTDTSSSGGCHLTVTGVDTSSCPTIRVTVAPTDDSGQGIPNLGPSNFGLTEDGASRSISVACGSQTSSQSSVAIVIDESGSLSTSDFAAEISAAKNLTNLLPSTTAVAVYFFGDSVVRWIDFTTNKSAVIQALDSKSFSAGATALYDGIVVSSTELGARFGQRIAVVMTDGVNTAGTNTQSSAISTAVSTGVNVYTIGFGSADQTVLGAIASQTSGQFYFGSDSSALAQIVSRIGSVITSQCTITFTSPFTTGTHTSRISLNTGSCSTSVDSAIARSCSTGSGCKLTAANPDTSSCPTVKIAVTPTDSTGNPLTGLGPGNFTLTEDGSSRSISVSCGSSTAPSSVAIAIDESGSLSSSDFAAEISAAKSLVNLLPSGTAIGVYFFGTTVNRWVNFTTDKASVISALDSKGFSAGSTALYDAIVQASNELAARAGQRIAVVMTDGVDTASTNSYSAAVTAATGGAVNLYTIGFGSADTSVLQQLATSTGGQFYFGTDSSSLSAIVSRIGATISSQCTITYTSPSCSGTHNVVITMNYQGCTITATATVTLSCCTSSCSGPYFYYVPAGSHAAGQNNTLFVSDLGIQNEGSGTAAISLAMLERGKDNSSPVTLSLSIPAGTAAEYPDVFLTQFARSSVAAALRACSNQPLRVMSRNYNLTTSGTYGQGIPGYVASRATPSGGSSKVIFLYENANYRSNLGFVNTSAANVTVSASFYAQNGVSLGTTSYTMPPYGHIQRSNVLREVTSSSINNAWVVITPSGGGIFAYVSLVDNVTGDPTFMIAE